MQDKSRSITQRQGNVIAINFSFDNNSITTSRYIPVNTLQLLNTRKPLICTAKCQRILFRDKINSNQYFRRHNGPIMVLGNKSRNIFGVYTSFTHVCWERCREVKKSVKINPRSWSRLLYELE